MTIITLHVMMKVWLFRLFAFATLTTLAAQSWPGCPDHCGNLTVPYPFGTTEKCYLDENFFINCTSLGSGPTPYYGNTNIVVTNISLDGELGILNYIAKDCYDKRGEQTDNWMAWLWLSTLTVSNTRNKFMAVGCDTFAKIEGYRGNKKYTTGCVSSCQEGDNYYDESCSGVGCCKISIPEGLQNMTLSLSSFYNHTTVWKFNPCSYAFVVQEDMFNMSNTSFQKLNDTEELQMVINWSIGNLSCEEAKKLENYSCKANSDCVETKSGYGYLCKCLPGYEGNPYHPDGCKEIDECKNHHCVNGICKNIVGGFNCTCHKGFTWTNDTFCSKSGGPERALLVYVPLSVSIGVLALVFLSLMICWGNQKRKLIRQKEKFFEQNGGLMLQRRLSSDLQGSFETAKIFTEEELIKATNNYQQVVGEGGYGTVYKGVLPDKKVVAIKKPKSGAQTQTRQQTEQFINEVILLMQINHRNVVRLLGCCLDTELPILVYEFITNGTLYERIHKKGPEEPSLSWELRLKIATETAGALDYLHFGANTPILHRDIKTMNILLDENYTAKVADFGTSRLVPLDQDELLTLVQGTIGYLDPEYFHSSQLTEKSDVYSFGVVLAELLTGKKALSFDKAEGTSSNLAMSFLSLEGDDQLRRLIDNDIVDDANMDAIKEVANLTKTCLRIRGDERPTMREVAMELEGLRAMSKHPWGKVNNLHAEETEYLLGSPSIDNQLGSDLESGSSRATTAVYDSMQIQLVSKPYNDGR